MSAAGQSRICSSVAAVHWFSTYRVHHRVADRSGPAVSFCLAMRRTFTVRWAVRA